MPFFLAGGKKTEATVSKDEVSYTFSDLLPSCVYDFAITAISNNVSSEATTAKQVTGKSQLQNNNFCLT